MRTAVVDPEFSPAQLPHLRFHYGKKMRNPPCHQLVNAER
ncbi:hypothetical protein RSPO_c00260 [Ralstonia solanacearum Po82]|uniref:Uncharacterized protein n=1 Tax=Ralstonia solanacearum (strain Po82) TaxID=1031711 RepID=F6G6L9_RALS8|nr:hypothetical protein RSPO_c00260 [Ralstonia solanacearum Po82]